ncbi:MAG: PAS domain S-box protein [Candidatus Zixiibacteriota bacterium]
MKSQDSRKAGVLQEDSNRAGGAQQAIEDSKLLELLDRNLPCAIILTDAEGRITKWSGAAETIFGYEASQALDLEVRSLLSLPLHSLEESVSRTSPNASSAKPAITAMHKTGAPLSLAVKVARATDGASESCAYLLICEDLSAQRHAEAMAAEIRKQQEAILHNIPDMAWLKDTASRYVIVNDQFGKACNMSPKDVVGKDDWGLWPDDLAEKYRADDRAVIASRQRKRIDEPMVYADGSRFIIETIKTPIFDDNGNVIGTTGIARDVTEKTRVECALRDSEARYRTLFESSAAAFLLLSELEFVDCNERACTLFGLTRGQIIGNTPADLSPIEQPDGKSSHDAILLRLQACLSGAPQFFSWRFRGAAGTMIDAEVTFKAITVESKQTVFVEIRDMTSRLRAELRVQEQLRFLQQLIDTIPTPIFYKDLKGLLIGCNRSFAESVGKPRREILGVRAADLFPPDEARFISLHDEQLAQDHTQQNFECRLTFAGGAVHDVILYEAVYNLSNGEPGGFVGTIIDITDRKQIESQLRDNEELLQEAQRIGSIGHWELDIDTGVTSWSDELYRIFARDKSEGAVDFVHSSEGIHGDDHVMLVKSIEDCINSALPFNLDTAFARRNSETRYVQIQGRPVLDDIKKVKRIVGTVQDITDRKQVERSLMESHRLLTAMMTNLPGMIYRCRNDVDRTLEFASDGCEQLTGFPASDFIGNKRLSFGGLIHPDDRTATNQQLQSALNAHEQYELTYRILTAAGDEKWIWEHGWAEDDFARGKVVLQGLMLDISQQKLEDERRKRLTTAVEQAAEAIMITDITGKIQFVNPAFEEITGYSEAEVLGQNPRIMKSGRHKDSFYKTLWETILRGDIWKGRLINRKKDGTLIEADASIRAVRDAQGKIINFVAVKRDVTKLMALEAQLRQAQKLEAVGALAAGIAHEINTPIQFVGDNTHFLAESFAEMLTLLDVASELAKSKKECDDYPQEYKDFLRAIGKADLDYFKQEIPRAIEQSLQGIDRVANIVRAMKEFSHPDQREKSAIDINRAIKTTLTVAHNELKYVADVIEDLSPDLPTLQGYASELNQVFLNLMVNAAHAISEVVQEGKGRGTIIVRSEPGDKCIIVSISDTGSGINPEVRERLFEPFFTTKEVGRGTGQGLAIARSVVVEKHGGEIYFETEVGKGTTFFVKLPLTEAEEGLI